MGKFLKHSLFLHLALLVLISSGSVLIIVLVINYQKSKTLVLETQYKQYQSLAKSSAQEIDAIFREAEVEVEKAVNIFKISKNSRENAKKAIVNIISHNPSVMGAAIALAEGRDYNKSGYQILYGWKVGNEYKIVDREAQADYQSDWFYLPFYLKKSVWSNPYFDNDSKTMMTTYSVPVIIDGKVEAIITCDISLKYIQELLENLELGKQGDATLISEFGQIIVHPNPEFIMRETLVSLSESCPHSKDRQRLREFVNLMKTKEQVYLKMHQFVDKKDACIFFNKIQANNWRVGFIIPQKEILEPVVDLSRFMTLIAVLGLLLILIPAFLVSLSVTRPLKEVCAASALLASGNFDAVLPKRKRNDEIGQLVHDFDTMRIDLKAFMRNLAKTTAEKEKISHELAIAEEIQHSILPKLFPPFPERDGLDLFAILHSAKEVGGDLYDFTLLDDDHLYICIGDVSGKGVPASLFMAVGKTLLKSTIQTISDPAKALFHVNNELEDGNDACMFITVFCGILNLKTNELVFANAGHNPPVIVNGDQSKYLVLDASAPLAVMPDTIFENQTITINKDEKILLYTDGVTEAMNKKFEIYDEDRLIDLLKEDHTETAEKCINNVFLDVKKFAKGAEQSDDITMLCLSYNPHDEAKNSQLSPTSSLTIANTPEEYNKLIEWLEDLQVKLKWPHELLMQLNLVLEEWVVNVMAYAYKDQESHQIEVRLWQSPTEILIEICDDGFAFNPLEKEAPNLDLPMEEREIGGLGIHFIKEIMDELNYERKDNMNVFSFMKKLDKEG